MSVRIVRYFDPQQEAPLSLEELNQWALERFRTLLNHPNTDIDNVEAARAMSDADLLQVLHIAGLAATVGLMKDEYAYEYAIQAVLKGEAISPFHERMRSMTSFEYEDDDKIIVMPITTFPEFFDQVTRIHPPPDSGTWLSRKERLMKDALKQAFQKRHAKVVEEFDNIADHPTSFERDRLTWFESEIDAPPAKSEAVMDILRMMADAMDSAND